MMSRKETRQLFVQALLKLNEIICSHNVNCHEVQDVILMIKTEAYELILDHPEHFSPSETVFLPINLYGEDIDILLHHFQETLEVAIIGKTND
jgi:hypothetical protein